MCLEMSVDAMKTKLILCHLTKREDSGKEG